MVSPAAPDLTDDLTDAELAADLAADAGKLLLQVRAEIGFDQPWTLGEAGDRQANSLLLRRLQAERPGDAVLSEEAHDDLARLKSDRVWIIDPLDGTREFSTPGRDDWAVHIALWRRSSNGQPEITDAAVALPARGNVVYRTDTVTSGAAPAGVPGTLRIAVSATRPPAVLHRIRQTLAIQPVSIGSAGAKAMAVIDGYVDAYLHAGGNGVGFRGAGWGDVGRRHARVTTRWLAAAIQPTGPLPAGSADVSSRGGADPARCHRRRVALIGARAAQKGWSHRAV